jgi:hypothetical protein
MRGLYAGVKLGLSLEMFSSLVRAFFTRRFKEPKPVSSSEIRFHRRAVATADEYDARDYDDPDLAHEITKLQILLSEEPTAFHLLYPRQYTKDEWKAKKETLREQAFKADPELVPSRLRRRVDSKDNLLKTTTTTTTSETPTQGEQKKEEQ